jgi:hypothetical protein
LIDRLSLYGLSPFLHFLHFCEGICGYAGMQRGRID